MQFATHIAQVFLETGSCSQTKIAVFVKEEWGQRKALSHSEVILCPVYKLGGTGPSSFMYCESDTTIVMYNFFKLTNRFQDYSVENVRSLHSLFSNAYCIMHNWNKENEAKQKHE
ncbi:hypothetical protein VNO77_25857 [Canavalia gladiata]|uniref:Uncharacterized protein n=1 Tax=Canavalia gladiata TaxID=3824 RepID=A0AAN9Q503_CANGL